MDLEVSEKQPSQRRSTPTLKLQYKRRSSNDKERQFKCKLCFRVYKHERSLRSHAKKSHPERPYKCELCLAAFPLAKGLRKHTNEVHNKKKSYPCDVCDKMFKHKYDVRRHRRTHKLADDTDDTFDSIASLPEREYPRCPKQVPDDEPYVTHKFAEQNKGLCNFL